MLWILTALVTPCPEIYPSFSSRVTLNSLRPDDVYMHRRTGSALVQVMVCHLLDANPYITWNSSELPLIGPIQHFHSRKCSWNDVCKISTILFQSWCVNTYNHRCKLTVPVTSSLSPWHSYGEPFRRSRLHLGSEHLGLWLLISQAVGYYMHMHVKAHINMERGRI